MEKEKYDSVLYKALASEPSKNLLTYFKKGRKDVRIPPIINGAIYKAIASIRLHPADPTTILAEDKTGGEDVLIKTPHEAHRNFFFGQVLEFLFQERAYEVLLEQCTTPKPLGFIRQTRDTGERQYYLVTQFRPFVPGYYSIVTLGEALSLQAKKPLLRKVEWKYVCLNLIRAVYRLHKSDIYHNYIRPTNVLLEISDNRIVVLLTDFQNSCCGDRKRDTPIFAYKTKEESDARHKATARELYEQVNPLPTSDLYSVSYLILWLSTLLKLPRLQNYIVYFRLQEANKRDSHQLFFSIVHRLFGDEIKDAIDLTIQDRQPQSNGN